MWGDGMTFSSCFVKRGIESGAETGPPFQRAFLQVNPIMAIS